MAGHRGNSVDCCILPQLLPAQLKHQYLYDTNFYNMNFKTKAPWKLSSTRSYLLPLQETTGMLQTQLQEAQQELEQGAQQHRDDLAALREEGSTLLQDKIGLQKQVPPPFSQHYSPSPA